MHVLANSASLDYWMATADGAPPALDLYPDFLRGREHVAATESVVFEVDSAAATALRAFAGSDPTRTRSALLAVWATLLYRYSGQTDVLVGFTESPSDRTFALARFRAGSDVRGEELLTQAADAVGQVSAASPGSSVSPVSMPEMLRAMGAEPAITSHPIFQAAIVFCDRASDLARSMSWSDDFALSVKQIASTAPHLIAWMSRIDIRSHTSGDIDAMCSRKVDFARPGIPQFDARTVFRRLLMDAPDFQSFAAWVEITHVLSVAMAQSRGIESRAMVVDYHRAINNFIFAIFVDIAYS